MEFFYRRWNAAVAILLFFHNVLHTGRKGLYPALESNASCPRRSAMPTSLSPIPSTAPFAEEEIEVLNRVVAAASPRQRAWLAGFLAGLDASAMPAQPAAAARSAEPLTILFASESGNCERLAADLAKSARKQGLKPSVVDMADLDIATLAQSRRL